MNGMTVRPTNISATARDVKKNLVKYLCLDVNWSLMITAGLKISNAKTIKTEKAKKDNFTDCD